MKIKWGTPLNSKNNKYQIFYHGTSFLIFEKLVSKFSSPTSTTSSIAKWYCFGIRTILWIWQ